MNSQNPVHSIVHLLYHDIFTIYFPHWKTTNFWIKRLTPRFWYSNWLYPRNRTRALKTLMPNYKQGLKNDRSMPVVICRCFWWVNSTKKYIVFVNYLKGQYWQDGNWTKHGQDITIIVQEVCQICSPTVYL